MRCFFGFHKWGKWKRALATFTDKIYGIVIREGAEREIQTRECILCGKFVWRKV